MGIAISSIGLATAQGNSASIVDNAALRAPEPWPWPVSGWCTSQACRPAAGLDSSLNGLRRWQALAQLALNDCFGDQLAELDTPLFIGSCNGSAADLSPRSWSTAFDSHSLLEGTAWADQDLPVFSSSCNSGLHALYAAEQVLLSGQADEVVVLAADILSRSNQDNFESLRVLTGSQVQPWQPTSTGFILGEAAVALRLVRAEQDTTGTRLIGPVLASELDRDDGLPRVLQKLPSANARLLLGQGTGPVAGDDSELAAFRRFVPGDVPLATPLVHFGHTLGASGLLGVALASLVQRTREVPANLLMPFVKASDGRALNTQTNGRPASFGNVLVSCRALNGSCAAAVVGDTDAFVHQAQPTNHDAKVWQAPTSTGPLMNPVLRRIANQASAHRPVDPPDVLVIRMQEPLAPPPDAIIGDRLLPSAVLEMTPGFVPQLIARCWGFTGPSLCLVGNPDVSDAGWNLDAALADLDRVVARVDLPGTGDKREIVWNN